MSASSIPQKHWFTVAMDLFYHVENFPNVQKKSFTEQATLLTKQIQNLAIIKFQIHRKELDKLILTAFTDTNLAPRAERLSTLVTTELFRLLVSTRLESLNDDEDEFYYYDIIPKMIKGVAEKSLINLSFIDENECARDWLSNASETMQKPKERFLMSETMSKIPRDYYDKTQMDRMKIGARITTKNVCLDVKRLLKGSPLASPSELATTIYNIYLNDLINKAPEETQEPLRWNIVVSLNIRARQLP